MKRRVIGILMALMMLVTGIVNSAQAQQVGVPLLPAATPKAVCAVPVWDFGRVSNTSRVEHVFELANAGLAPLQIQRVATGCGCTAAQTGADHIEPGGKTQVTVRFNPAGRTGMQRKGVYVHTNDPEMPVLHLELIGEAFGTSGTNNIAGLASEKTVTVPETSKAKGDLYAIPEEITVVTRLGMTNTVTRYVSIRSRNGNPFQLEGVTVDEVGLATELSPLAGDKGYLLKVCGLVSETNGTLRTITVQGRDNSKLPIPICTIVLREGA